MPWDLGYFYLREAKLVQEYCLGKIKLRLVLPPLSGAAMFQREPAMEEDYERLWTSEQKTKPVLSKKAGWAKHQADLHC